MNTGVEPVDRVGSKVFYTGDHCYGEPVCSLYRAESYLFGGNATTQDLPLAWPKKELAKSSCSHSLTTKTPSLNGAPRQFLNCHA